MATKTTKKDQSKLENITFEGFLTNTSNRVSEDFKSETPTKACYFKVCDSETVDILEEFGVKFYTPDGKESNLENNFAVIRASRKIAIYTPRGDDMALSHITGCVQDGVGESVPNFKTPEEKPATFNIIKGEKAGNTFIRLQAILVEKESDIEEIIPNNPFKKTVT